MTREEKGPGQAVWEWELGLATIAGSSGGSGEATENHQDSPETQPDHGNPGNGSHLLRPPK